jgi:hypothetical protein
MAVHSHYPEPELPRQPWSEAYTRDGWSPKGESVGQMGSPMFGRPPYWAIGSKRQCQGVTQPGFRCQHGALWLIPEFDFCAHHMPRNLIGVLIARRDLWIALASDLWKEVVMDCPVDLSPHDRSGTPIGRSAVE